MNTRGSVVERPFRVRKVMGSTSIWRSVFFGTICMRMSENMSFIKQSCLCVYFGIIRLINLISISITLPIKSQSFQSYSSWRYTEEYLYYPYRFIVVFQLAPVILAGRNFLPVPNMEDSAPACIISWVGHVQPVDQIFAITRQPGNQAVIVRI